MRQEQLEGLKTWFDGYVSGFYGQDEFVNRHIKVKQEHTHRTCHQMQHLTACLKLNPNQQLIAQAMSLLHDVGRFRQFASYRTYNDLKSANHALLGLEVIDREEILDNLSPEERDLIKKSIEYHGMKELPPGLDKELLFFSRLIRDADKIDVLYIISKFYKRHKQSRGSFELELEVPDEEGYSTEVVNKVLAGRTVDYKLLRTLNDMKIVQLGWVVDVNFIPTLKRIRDLGVLEEILDCLPQDQTIEKIRKYVFGYVDARIKKLEVRS